MSHTKHHDGADNSGKAAAPTDAATVQQKLFEDLQGKYFPGNTKPDNVSQLVKDGILPEGSTIIDLGSVRTSLAGDKEKQAALEGQKPADTTAATKAVSEAEKGVQNAQGAVDQAEAKVKPVADRMENRSRLDNQMKADYATVSKATGDDTIYKNDLPAIAADASKPQAVRDAAQRMLNTFEKHTVMGGRGGRTPVSIESSDYGDRGGWSGKLYIDKESLDAGIKKHQDKNLDDQKTLDPLKAAVEQAKNGMTKAEEDVTKAKVALSTLENQNENLSDQKAQIATRIKQQEAILTPDSSIDKDGRVVKGGGYYQVAENLLGISDKGRHTTLQEKELKMLTHMLQDEARQLNGGKLPKYLKQNDPLLQADHIQAVLDKLRPVTTPSGQ